jgi:hypothetical protein
VARQTHRDRLGYSASSHISDGRPPDRERVSLPTSVSRPHLLRTCQARPLAETIPRSTKVSDGLIVRPRKEVVAWFLIGDAIAQQTVNFGGHLHDSTLIILC